MVYYEDEDEDEEETKTPKKPKKVYVIIDGERHFIDPEMARKYNLENLKTSYFSGRRIYIEKG